MRHYKKLQPTTEAILRIRKWEEAHLPVDQSALAYDLLTVVAHNTVAGTPVSLKQLFISLNYSEAGIRKQLRRMLAEEWLALEGIKKDRRVRVIVAKPKMLDVLTTYAEVLKEAYSKDLFS